MRFSLPRRSVRHRVRDLLLAYFDERDGDDLHDAMRALAQFYDLAMPTIGWRRQIDRGWTAGRTHSTGRIELIRPDHWHRQHVCKPTPDEWAATAIHEFYHYLTWVDEERKADDFARRWMEE